MRRLISILSVITSAVILSSCPDWANASWSSTLETRYERLRKGVNLAHWFWFNGGDSEFRKAFITPQELSRLRSIGITSVRLMVNPGFIYDSSYPSDVWRKNPSFMSDLKAAIGRIASTDITTVVTLTADKNFKKQLYYSGDDVDKFARFWTALAKELSYAAGPDYLLMEVINEPTFFQFLVDEGRGGWDDAYWATLDKAVSLWQPIQETLLKAMRVGAPSHTLVATSDSWSSFDALVRLKPYADSNLIYSAHNYDHITFTHQGAWWMDAAYKEITGLQWPTDQANCHAVVPKLSPESKSVLGDYCQGNGWNKWRLKQVIAPAAAWASANKVKLWVGEFGVFSRGGCPQSSSDAYLADMRWALEDAGLAWTVYDYYDWLQSMWRPEILSALGLKSSSY